MHRVNNAQSESTATILLRGLWLLVRLPIFTLLVILEPVIALVLGGLALAGVLTTIFFVAVHAPHFPAWTMLTMSVGFGLVLMLYEAVLRVFTR
jgi:fructose-specific phosphotransferase system IIC component